MKKNKLLKIALLAVLCVAMSIMFVGCGNVKTSSIEVINADKITYADGQLDFSGAKIKVTKTDGKTEEVAILSDMIVVPQSFNEGENIVGIMYDGLETSIAVNITGTKGDPGEKGDKGDPGADGAKGEKGDPGENGKSAYQLYVSNNPGYERTEAEWLDDLVTGRLALIAEVNAMLADYSEADYNESNWTLIGGIKADAYTAIYGLRSINDVTAYDMSEIDASLKGVMTGNGSADKPYLVASRAALEEAVTGYGADNAYITLAGDIVNDGAYSDLRFRCRDNDLNFTLDLAGHTLGMEIDVIGDYGTTQMENGRYKKYDHSIDITFTDSSETKSGRIGIDNSDCWYGFLIQGGDNINLTLDGITSQAFYGGIYSNGASLGGGTVTARNCTFTGAGNDESVGSYLATNHTYNFENCKFTGDSGYYTKSGTHVLKNCTFTGTGTYRAPNYNGNGADPTGSAVVIDSAKNYTQKLDVTIDGGTFNSTYGYDVEECSTTTDLNYCENLTLIGVDIAAEDLFVTTEHFNRR